MNPIDLERTGRLLAEEQRLLTERYTGATPC